jgi:tRNA threonylcarbamoyladenosine biosynthesis protein TsaB
VSSLLYQVGLKKGISILDARGHKFYLGVYNQGKVIETEQVVTEDQLPGLIAKYTSQGYEVFQDYQQLDYRQNFLSLQSHFKLVTDVEDIAPLYVKNFI